MKHAPLPEEIPDKSQPGSRGIQRGEFRSIDLDYGIYTVVAPMIFLMLSKHSMGVCVRDDLEMDPKQYIATQVNTILYGLSIAPGDSAPDPKKA